ncbi:MAG: signal peptidase I [Chloroflexi bacterium]|nr:MAG: signal peptidase I [Chloroflexota bacterium]
MSVAQPGATQPASGRQKSFFRDTLEIVFLALALYLVIQYAVQTVHVLGSSMYATLSNNDLLVASKISYKLHPPQRGDIVIFKPPDPDVRDFIKRVIAVPGDRLRIDHGTVYINGEILREPYLPEKWTYSNSWPATGQDYVLPPDHYFVMGDNRNHSSDSRVFGPIDASSILGKAEIRIWPLNEFGLLTSRPTLSTGP